jgi:hypothetical protein
MPISLWFQSRVKNDKAKSDLQGFGNYAEKFGKDLTQRFIGTGALIASGIKAAMGAVQLLQAASKDAIEASKLGVTVEQFQNLQFAAEMTGASVSDMVAKLKEGGPAAEALNSAFAQLNVSSGAIDENMRRQMLFLETKKTGFLNWAKGAVATGASNTLLAHDLFTEWFSNLLVGEGPLDTDVILAQLRAELDDQVKGVDDALKIIKDAMGKETKPNKGAKTTKEKVDKFSGVRPTMAADQLAAIGGATLLSGVVVQNFQRDLLAYSKESADYTKEIARNTQPLAGGFTAPV